MIRSRSSWSGRSSGAGGGPAELLAYRDGRRWHDVRSDDINDYLKEHLGEEFSAKDFRTWNATVMAAVTLAADGREADEDRSQTRDQRRGPLRGRTTR